MIKNEENLKKTKVEKIDFDELANEYKVDNIDMFISYLKEIFKVILKILNRICLKEVMINHSD